MADKRSGRVTGDRTEDWRHLLRVGGLVTAVVGTLILGALLEVGTGEAERAELPTTARPDLTPMDPAVPEVVDFPASEEIAHPPLAAPTPLDRLTDRAAADYERLAGTSGWTLQFMVACDPDNIAPLHDRLAGNEAFFLLPKLHDDRACFRVLWGRFPDREAAVAASAEVPAVLARVTDRPQPLPVNRVLE